MRFSKLFRADDKKSELDEEITAHLAMAAAEKRDRGADAETAEQEARREFGNAALVKDVTRESWGWLWLERLLQDLRYAARQMRRSPGFAAAVVGTLALGIGAATAMFTVVDRVLLRPLPYPHPSQLVDVSEGEPGGNAFWYGVPYLDLAAWRSQSKSFAQIAYYTFSTGRSFLGGTTASTEISFVHVSSNFFQALAVGPQLGPGLPRAPESFAKSAAANTIVLSDTAWRTIFAADRNIVGKSVEVNDQPYTVAGVMPRGFNFPYDSHAPEAWSPLLLSQKDQVRKSDSSMYSVIARLRPGVKLASALAELNILQKRIVQNYTDPDARSFASHVQMAPYSAGLVEQSTARALYALLSAALLLWLIACVNATNLLLARAMARQRETAMRSALGASRWRVTQQLIVEGFLLSGTAALIGAGMGSALILLFHHALKSHLPFDVPVLLNLPVLAGLIVLTLVSAVLAAAWPAWIASHAPIEPGLRQGGQQSGTSRAHHRLRGGLVIAEIAMSLTLLAACGLLLRTIYALRHVPLGFRTDHIIVANLQIPTYRFTRINADSDLYEPLLERIQHMPGIDGAGLMTEVPLGHTFRMTLSLYGDAKSGHSTVQSNFKAVSPNLQSVFGFHMLAGRYFNAQDTASSDPVVVVNQAFARAYAPDQQNLSKVLGMQLIKLGKGKESKSGTIIGILDDFRQASVSQAATPEIEVNLPQITPTSGFYTVLEGIAMDLAVRTQRPLSVAIPEIRAALRQASPELANSNMTTMDQIVEDSYGSQMLAARLLEIFAGCALLLCVAGLYGLLAYVVSQRTREMGVRFALGAQREDVIWLILRHAGTLVITGVALGLVLAFVSTRFIRSYLYGVSAHDAWTLAAVALVLLASGAVAAYLPARRAAQVNPVEALRAE
ncbi:MAG TPA: ABC transporter permease [Silvibacterium sp.]|nr:ABC transporter permease [Silvibacterium sp.]